MHCSMPSSPAAVRQGQLVQGAVRLATAWPCTRLESYVMLTQRSNLQWQPRLASLLHRPFPMAGATSASAGWEWVQSSPTDSSYSCG